MFYRQKIITKGKLKKSKICYFGVKLYNLCAKNRDEWKNIWYIHIRWYTGITFCTLVVHILYKDISYHAKWKRKRSNSVQWQKPIHRQKSPKSNVTTTRKNATKNLDYRTIADRLRTFSWGNDSHPTGGVYPVYGIPTFPLIAKDVLSKGHTFKN